MPRIFILISLASIVICIASIAVTMLPNMSDNTLLIVMFIIAVILLASINRK